MAGGILRAFNTQYAAIAGGIMETNALGDDLEARLKDAITTFNAGWSQ